MYFTYAPYTVTVHINITAVVCFDSNDVSGPQNYGMKISSAVSKTLSKKVPFIG